MSEFVEYAKQLMDSAKGLVVKSKSVTNQSVEQAYLRSALLHGFFFLEAQLNYIAEHFEEGEMFSVHEKGVLLERDVGLEKGKFILRKNERYYRLVDRIELILTKCAADPVKAKGTWFADLKNAIIKRNKLVHPREAHKVTVQDIERALAAIIDCVDTLHRCVFRKAFPYKKNSMDAGLNFD